MLSFIWEIPLTNQGRARSKAKRTAIAETDSSATLGPSRLLHNMHYAKLIMGAVRRVWRYYWSLLRLVLDRLLPSKRLPLAAMEATL